MRFLLLLSALLTALSGVAGTRAAAQPVQASASASIAIPRVAAVAAISSRFTTPPYGTVPPLRLAMPLMSAVTARVLYAERRRE